jgi:hypothetical protein
MKSDYLDGIMHVTALERNLTTPYIVQSSDCSTAWNNMLYSVEFCNFPAMK